jgi:hypothetical protein
MITWNIKVNINDNVSELPEQLYINYITAFIKPDRIIVDTTGKGMYVFSILDSTKKYECMSVEELK